MGTESKAIRTALVAGIFIFGADNLSAQDRDWGTRGIEGVQDVRSYCAYLDTFIPYAFQSERHFGKLLSSTKGKENLDYGALVANWQSVVKLNSEIWGALGCAQILYGANAAPKRAK